MAAIRNSQIDWHQLGSPKLTRKEIDYLDERHMPLSLAGNAGLRSLTPEQTAAIWPGREFESMLVPFSKFYGAARLFGSDTKWLSTPGKGARIYEAPLPGIDWDNIRRSPDQELLIIEGPIKALAAIANNRLAIGLTGCWNWQKDRQPLPALRKYKWAGRTVTPVFDADITENNNVALPYLLLGDWLQSQGAKVLHVRIPKVRGKHTGFDDFVAANGVRK